MRNFLCGFTTPEVNYLMGNSVSEMAQAAAQAHDDFTEANTCATLDVFMDTIRAWRESADYPFKTAGGL